MCIIFYQIVVNIFVARRQGFQELAQMGVIRRKENLLQLSVQQ